MTLARARELAVLSILRAHPAHGYDISRAVAAGPLALLGLSRSAVYAILDRFERRGWIVGETTVSSSYPDKTVMSLTRDGHAAHEAALAAVSEPPGPPVAPLMAVMLAHDAGARLPSELVSRMVGARRDSLAELIADKAHASSATGQLAQRLIEAELSVLETLAPEV